MHHKHSPYPSTSQATAGVTVATIILQHNYVVLFLFFPKDFTRGMAYTVFTHLTVKKEQESCRVIEGGKTNRSYRWERDMAARTMIHRTPRIRRQTR